MNEAEFEKFHIYYYQFGTPDQAPAALEYFVTSEMLQKATPGGIKPMLYFWSRIAEDRPEVVRRYEAVVGRVSHEGRLFILWLLELAGDEKTREFLDSCLKDELYEAEASQIEKVLESRFPNKLDVFQRPIQDGTDLDLLWAEFIVTTNRQAVVRIIDVLEWPDKIREKFQTWLESKLRLGFLIPEVRRKRTLDRLAKSIRRTRSFTQRPWTSAGIVCDLANNRIETAEDLDCLCLLEQLAPRSREDVEEIIRALPFPLSSEDCMHMGLKSTAKWSLGSNAKQHPLVLETCREELHRRTERVGLGLLHILVDAYLERHEWESALPLIEQFLSIDPTNMEMRSNRECAFREVRLSRLACLLKLAHADLPPGFLEPGEVTTTVRRCIAALRRVKSYRSIVVVKDLACKELEPMGHEIIRWRLDFVSPDEVHVNQDTPLDNFPDSVADEWITIGAQHYERLGPWSLESDSSSRDLRDGINRLVRLDRYVAVLENGKLNKAVSYQTGDVRYVMLEFALRPEDSVGPWRITELRSGLAESLHHMVGQGEEGDDHGQVAFFLLPVVSELVPERSILKFHDAAVSTSGLTCRLVLWVDATKHLIAKADTELIGKLEDAQDGQDVWLRLEQVFGDYDGDIIVREPEELVHRI